MNALPERGSAPHSRLADALRALSSQRIRRDWRQLTMWILGTALLAYASFAGVAETYGTEQERASILAAALANPVILLFRGLPSGSGDGEFIAFLIVPWLAMLAALMSSFLAVRHTRGDEEAGRAEIVSATPAARMLPTIATLLHGIGANVLLGGLTALAFVAVGLDAGGSTVMGLAVASVGFFFLGFGLVAAQLMRTSRGANSLAMAVLLGTFLLAGIGNALGTPSDDLKSMTSSWVAWLSPFAWAENTRPYSDDAIGPVILTLLVAIVLVVAALALQRARDVGGAFVPERNGRADATATLSSPSALVWRLTYPAVIAWGVGAAIVGLLATSLGSVIDQLGAQNPAVANVLEQIAGDTGSLQEGVLVTFFTMVGIFAACCAVQTVVRARQEETHGTAELLLSTPLSRVRWLASFLSVGLAAVILIAAIAVGGAALGMGSDSSDLLDDAVVAGVGQALAATVFLGLTGLIFVVAPRATIGVGWSSVALATVLGLFGPLFGMPDWAVHLSPFAATPMLSGGEVDARGGWWLLFAAGLGVAASLALMRRRELVTGG
ncbi:ABC transporter permease [Microbacterium sp. DT81.1]|uniref:ABC transporter permease n=1 Tax=Microbacterium sp. DT81.1 TaxID=3393413 RepID=UPI003CF72A23